MTEHDDSFSLDQADSGEGDVGEKDMSESMEGRETFVYWDIVGWSGWRKFDTTSPASL